MEGPEDTHRSGPSSRLPWIAFGLLCAGLLALFVVFPTYPNYDSYYALLWAREIWDGQKPVFDAFRAPTEHPLAILFSMVLTPLGEGADRVVVFCALASVAALAAGMYQLATAAFNRWVGLVAGVLLVANWDLIFLAVRGYLDVTYMALVIWAAVLETRRRRRGWPVLVLLTLAGTLRPEGWVLCGLYGLWMAWDGAPLRPVREGLRNVLTRRGILWLAFGCVATAIWLTTDFVVTGNPLFSQTYTSGLAEELGRTRGPLEIPFVTIAFLKGIDGTALFFAGIVGLLVTLWIVPRRASMPLVLLVAGIGTFFLLGFGGFSVIDRYLLVPAALLLIFAAVLLAGWTLMPAGRVRTWWSRLSLLGGVGVVVVGAINLNPNSLANDLTFRGDAHHDLVDVLDRPVVRRALRCGPLWTPNHKLVPDSRWILDAGTGDVLARSMLKPALFDRDVTGFDSPDRRLARREAPSAAGLRRADGKLRYTTTTGKDGKPVETVVPDPTPRISRGVVLLPTSRLALIRQGYVFVGDDRAFDSIPPVGFRRIATSVHYTVYASC
ncbi:hypothetical protein [Patulibacter sp.]|uniref:hypothetical protein n=1 Tax=Patulibacter sp. TaxID=1912859 RepID=UPI0027179429|nr:hypothetical protein [Patulibacter sp.]MDO9409932.1 hypothetical protein [Patulibacter sp.]